MDAGICSTERPVTACAFMGSHNVRRDYVKNGPAKLKNPQGHLLHNPHYAKPLSELVVFGVNFFRGRSVVENIFCRFFIQGDDE
ncbi:hypothetical protein [Pectobacterium carotovorum]|uniref:hypothetical protein n=1 Tax=Pectobacterium carotovorum TaxID=554 RepID=UPI003018D37B